MARLGQEQLQTLDLQGAGLGFVLRGGQHLALRQDHRVSAHQVVRKPARQAVGALFGGVRHDANKSISGSKNRRRNIP
jgi:hypothetical protein